MELYLSNIGSNCHQKSSSITELDLVYNPTTDVLEEWEKQFKNVYKALNIKIGLNKKQALEYAMKIGAALDKLQEKFFTTRPHNLKWVEYIEGLEIGLKERQERKYRHFFRFCNEYKKFLDSGFSFEKLCHDMAKLKKALSIHESYKAQFKVIVE